MRVVVLRSVGAENQIRAKIRRAVSTTSATSQASAILITHHDHDCGSRTGLQFRQDQLQFGSRTGLQLGQEQLQFCTLHRDRGKREHRFKTCNNRRGHIGE